jgi:hypothetical protein
MQHSMTMSGESQNETSGTKWNEVKSKVQRGSRPVQLANADTLYHDVHVYLRKHTREHHMPS